MGIRIALLGCAAAVGMLGVGSPIQAAPINYGLLTTIPITPDSVNRQGGSFNAFDISYFDPSTRLDYFADRSNASIDVIDGTSMKLVSQIGGFVGQQMTTSISGPDGVVVANANGIHTLFGGDGNSTLRAYNLGTSLTSPPLAYVTPTGGTHRVDEMAYSPSTNLLLVANNADAPAFATLIDATTGAIVHGNIVIPGAAAGDGLEQPVWNPITKSFFVSVPAFGGGTDPGGLAEIKTDGTIGQLFKFAPTGISSCSPAGLAIGASGNLLVGCGNNGTQTVVYNPVSHALTEIQGISGSDEVYYDPTTMDFFVTGTANGSRVFDVIADSLTGAVLQSVVIPGVTTAINAHSISVDPADGDVFVPLEGLPGNTLCPTGCVAVFAQNVPEPGTFRLVAPVAAVLAFLGLRRRRARPT